MKAKLLRKFEEHWFPAGLIGPVRPQAEDELLICTLDDELEIVFASEFWKESHEWLETNGKRLIAENHKAVVAFFINGVDQASVYPVSFKPYRSPRIQRGKTRSIFGSKQELADMFEASCKWQADEDDKVIMVPLTKLQARLLSNVCEFGANTIGVEEATMVEVKEAKERLLEAFFRDALGETIHPEWSA